MTLFSSKNKILLGRNQNKDTGASMLHAWSITFSSFATLSSPSSGDPQSSSFPVDKQLPTTAEPLGKPLPDDQHACSVSLPNWSDVVGYEEGDINVLSQMPSGYPRFVYHPYIIQLGQCVVEKYGSTKMQQDCLLLPSREAALRCQSFLKQALYPKEEGPVLDVCRITQNSNDVEQLWEKQQQDSSSNAKIRVVDLQSSHGVHAVLFPAETSAGIEAKAYWQHTGEIVSSRCAEAVLCEIFEQHCSPGTPHCAHGILTSVTEQERNSAHSALQDRIASFAHVPSDHVFLTPSGMSGLYMSLLASRRVVGEDAASVVFGFPYLDTLKFCSRTELCPGGVDFYGHGHEQDLRALEVQLRQGRRVCALLTEVPSNPLLRVPDLHTLRRLADEHNFCLVVDDTIGNFANVPLMESGLADAVCTSLTKLVSGRGDAMAGSLVCNPNTEMGSKLQQDLQQHYKSDLHPCDADAIVKNSENFLERNAQINETAEQLADFLQAHPDVQTVWYPKYTPLYETFASQPNAYGGLMSILLDEHICQRTFYDALEIAKGPSLGTNFTLACPYTLLAHYHELDFAMHYNVQPNLLRISVGLESFPSLKDKFESALATSRLHPKIQRKGSSSGGGGGALQQPQQRRSYSTRITSGDAGSLLLGSSRQSALRMGLRFALRGRGAGF